MILNWLRMERTELCYEYGVPDIQKLPKIILSKLMRIRLVQKRATGRKAHLSRLQRKQDDPG